MTEKGFRTPTAPVVRLTGPDFEQVLERLIVMAEADGREFLAYLLTMALIHLRDEDPNKTGAPH